MTYHGPLIVSLIATILPLPVRLWRVLNLTTAFFLNTGAVLGMGAFGGVGRKWSGVWQELPIRRKFFCNPYSAAGLFRHVRPRFVGLRHICYSGNNCKVSPDVKAANDGRNKWNHMIDVV